LANEKGAKHLLYRRALTAHQTLSRFFCYWKISKFQAKADGKFFASLKAKFWKTPEAQQLRSLYSVLVQTLLLERVDDDYWLVLDKHARCIITAKPDKTKLSWLPQALGCFFLFFLCLYIMYTEESHKKTIVNKTSAEPNENSTVYEKCQPGRRNSKLKKKKNK
jgi:hypothetical protein